VERVKAYIVHQSRGRVRFRVPERRHQAEYFARCCGIAEGWPDVWQVDANPSTASLLIQYQGDESAIIERSHELGFELGSKVPEPVDRAKVPVWQLIADGLEIFNKNLQKTTDQRLDLASLLFVGLLTHGLVQFVRRPSPVMGWETAWWFALNVYMMVHNQAKDKPNTERVINQ